MRHRMSVSLAVFVCKYAVESSSWSTKSRKILVRIITFFFPNLKQRMMMTPLTREECQQLLLNYETALTSRIDGHRSNNAAKDLLELDSWRLNNLSKTVRERNPSFMTK